MMRLAVILAALVIVVPNLASAQATRCAQDDWIASPTDARGRNAWSRKCGYLSTSQESFLNGEGMYIVYSNGCYNNIAYGCVNHVPIAESALCVTGLIKLAYCFTGCYTPEQRLSFNSEFTGIKQAFDMGVASVTAMTPASTPSTLFYSEQPIRTFVAGDTQEDIYVLKTVDGRRLEVTAKHPMVKGDGTMVKASELKAGEELLGADGKKLALQEVSTYVFKGTVWNVQPTSHEKAENVLNAEGLLTGSVRFQNEWADLDYRVSMRDELDVSAL